MKSLNSPDAEERRSTLKTLAGPTDSQGHSEIAGQAEVGLELLFLNFLCIQLISMNDFLSFLPLICNA